LRIPEKFAAMLPSIVASPDFAPDKNIRNDPDFCATNDRKNPMAS
jgi:hypothetical protein